jgi:hypothetical protein
MKSLQRKNGGMNCRQAIKDKNIARMKCLQQKTRTNQEHYKEKRKEIKCVHKERNCGLTTK